MLIFHSHKCFYILILYLQEVIRTIRTKTSFSKNSPLNEVFWSEARINPVLMKRERLKERRQAHSVDAAIYVIEIQWLRIINQRKSTRLWQVLLLPGLIDATLYWRLPFSPAAKSCPSEAGRALPGLSTRIAPQAMDGRGTGSCHASMTRGF